MKKSTRNLALANVASLNVAHDARPCCFFTSPQVETLCLFFLFSFLCVSLFHHPVLTFVISHTPPPLRLALRIDDWRILFDLIN